MAGNQLSVDTLVHQIQSLRQAFVELADCGLRFGFCANQSGKIIGLVIEASEEEASRLISIVDRGGKLLKHVRAVGWKPSYWKSIARQKTSEARWVAYSCAVKQILHVHGTNGTFFIDEFADVFITACDDLMASLLNAVTKPKKVKPSGKPTPRFKPPACPMCDGKARVASTKDKTRQLKCTVCDHAWKSSKGRS